LETKTVTTDYLLDLMTFPSPGNNRCNPLYTKERWNRI